MTYDLLTDEEFITDLDNGKLVLTNQRLGIKHVTSNFFPLEQVLSIKLILKRNLLVLIPGILLAPIYVLYQVGTATSDVKSSIPICIVFIIGSIIRYFIFPDKTLLVETAEHAVNYKIKGLEDDDVDNFINRVEQEIDKIRPQNL
ncbi:MAG: hypothetical protein JWQ25_730 [Daejeonella sp.]|nr:hypothetical protein [Daejeonella sp.]